MDFLNESLVPSPPASPLAFSHPPIYSRGSSIYTSFHARKSQQEPASHSTSY